VWLYFRFPLSLRLVEEMLLERGIVVSYETIRRWAMKFGPDYARRLHRKKPSRNDVWHPISKRSTFCWHLPPPALHFRFAIPQLRSAGVLTGGPVATIPAPQPDGAPPCGVLVFGAFGRDDLVLRLCHGIENTDR